MPARPGLNPLRFTTTYVVTRERFEQLRQTLTDINGRPPAAGESLNFFGRRFVVGDTPGLRTQPLQEDLDEIASVVKNAARLADLVLVTIHAHEGTADRLVPAQFLVTFARAHFAAEEALMDRYAIADRAAHKQAHRRLLQDALSLANSSRNSSMMVTVGFLHEWLLRHVDSADRELARQVIGQGVFRRRVERQPFGR